MNRVSCYGATFVKPIRNIRVYQSPLYQRNTASYHATGRVGSSIRFSDLELADPRPDYIFNRPMLKVSTSAVLKYGKIKPEAPESAFKAVVEFYKSRVGEEYFLLAFILWARRYKSMQFNYSPRDEALACMICAERAPLNQYPSIYYNLDKLADSLYLMSRMDLERGSEHRDSARYSLDMAAELGHLDAALLLHRLSFADRSVSVGQAAESVIKRAKDEGDWRATIAYIEQTQLRRVERMTWPGIVSTVAELYDMMQSNGVGLRSPNPELFRSRLSDLHNGQVDVDALETFDPPARILWQLCRYHYMTIIAQRKSDSKDLSGIYVEALQEDASALQNPEAMYTLISLPTDLRPKDLTMYDQNWISSVRQAAEAGIPEAKLNHGFWLLHNESLFPTLATQTGQYRPIYEGKIRWRHHEQAFNELRAAAEIFSEGQPDVAGYLYLIMAGVLSENGLHRDGHDLIKEAMECMVNATVSSGLDPRRVKMSQRLPALLKDLDGRWPKYETEGLYDDIRPARLMKNPAIASILMLPDSS